MAGLALALGLYAWLWAKSVRARGPRAGGQPAFFLVGLGVVALALESPIDAVGELYLFWVHMLQHMLLSVVAPPLLLLGLGGRLPPLPRPVRVALRVLTQPVVALVLFNAAFSADHVPRLLEWGLVSEPVHAVEHLVLMGLGLCAFWPVFSPTAELPPLPYPGQMAYLFAMGLAMTPIFAGIAFGDAPLYPYYAPGESLFGVDPLADQALGASVMKAMAGLAYGLAFFRAFVLWFAEVG
ncbi:MAG: cytochrome c oxidase assembly protein [Clostridia bacterium]|nr:cytochrome c oxidase assembly protein [Clostridia bacterium]